MSENQVKMACYFNEYPKSFMDSDECCMGKLNGYKLIFDQNGMAAVQKSEEDHVYGVILRLEVRIIKNVINKYYKNVDNFEMLKNISI